MSQTVLEVKSTEQFNQCLSDAGNKLVVVDFYATWCGPCKMIAPKIVEMAKAMNDVVFLKVDVEEAEELAVTYDISCMPTFILIKNGEKVHLFSGANDAKLKEKIEEFK